MPQTAIGQPIDQRSPQFSLPLPNINNWQDDDVPRLRSALGMIDAALQLLTTGLAAKASQAALTSLQQSSSAQVQALQQSTAQNLATGLQNSAAQLALVTARLDSALPPLQQAAARASAETLTWNTAGRVTAITRTVAGAVQTTSIAYDAAGRVASLTYPVPGDKIRTETFAWSAAGALTGMTALEAAR